LETNKMEMIRKHVPTSSLTSATHMLHC